MGSSRLPEGANPVLGPTSPSANAWSYEPPASSPCCRRGPKFCSRAAPHVRIDGQTLEPTVRLALSLLECGGVPPLKTLPLVEAREAHRRRVAVSNGPPTP